VGWGELLGRSEGNEKRKRKEGRGLGCTGREREKVCRANWAVREGEERPAWAGLQGKKREKEKERVGRAKLEKEREKEMHLNLNLKFKFKWKTNNKTMQWGMKCTKPIVPYIFFMV
jgi:hypothetical protein